MARPATLAYRTRMFARRNPWAIAAATVMAIAIVLFFVIQIRHTNEVETERNAAQMEAERAQEVQRFLVDLFASANPYRPADPDVGRRITVVEALDIGAERVEASLGERSEVRATILSAVSGAYQDLGAFERALPLREEALELQLSLYGTASRPVRDSLGKLATIRSEIGDRDAASELHERRLELVLAAEPADVTEIADARTRLGLHLWTLTQAEEAEKHLLAAVDLAAGADVMPETVAESTRALATVQRALDRLELSEETARRSIELAQSTFGKESTDAALARATLAATLSTMGRTDEADTEFRRAINILERNLGSDHSDLLTVMSNHAALLISPGRYAEAEVLLTRIIEIGERVQGVNHPVVGDYWQNYATVLTRLGRLEEARVAYERVVRIYHENLKENNYRRGMPLLSLSGVHLTLGDPVAAEGVAREALEILSRTLPEGHFITAIAHCRLARALFLQGRSSEAVAHFDSAFDPLVVTDQVPEYRYECLTAAARFYDIHGDRRQVGEIEAALGMAGR